MKGKYWLYFLLADGEKAYLSKSFDDDSWRPTVDRNEATFGLELDKAEVNRLHFQKELGVQVFIENNVKEVLE